MSPDLAWAGAAIARRRQAQGIGERCRLLQVDLGLQGSEVGVSGIDHHLSLLMSTTTASGRSQQAEDDRGEEEPAIRSGSPGGDVSPSIVCIIDVFEDGIEIDEANRRGTGGEAP